MVRPALPLLRRAVWLLSLLLADEGVASANIGVPMIFVTLPRMVMALVPIILVEALVFTWRLRTKPRQSLRMAASANLYSTFVGIPVAWVLLTVLEIATGGGQFLGLQSSEYGPLTALLQAPWLYPDRNSDIYAPDHWKRPAATLMLLVPFCLASYLTEAPIIRRLVPSETDHRMVNRAVLLANLVSYTLLTAWTASWLMSALDR